MPPACKAITHDLLITVVKRGIQYASVRDYLLTYFKGSSFFANKDFERTGEKQQMVPNVSTNKLHLSAVVCRKAGKLLRSLE
jgi:hypothetical protein